AASDSKQFSIKTGERLIETLVRLDRYGGNGGRYLAAACTSDRVRKQPLRRTPANTAHVTATRLIAATLEDGVFAALFAAAHYMLTSRGRARGRHSRWKLTRAGRSVG